MLVEIQLELVEELKEVLKGVEIFLTTTLKRISLKKDVNEKNYIVASVKELLKKLNRISGNIDADADSIELPDEEGIDEVGPIPALQLKNPTKVGLLRKRQQGFGLQKNTRFCMIKANVMYYYKKMGDKKQAGAIVLDGYDVRPAKQDDKKKEYAFELIHPTKRYYQFVTEDEPAMMAWIKAVRIATNKATDSEGDEETDKKKEEERTMIFHKDPLYATPLDEDETADNDPNHRCPPPDDHHARIHENQSTPIDSKAIIYDEIEELHNRRPSADPKGEELYADIPEREDQPTISDTSIPPTPPPRCPSHNLIDEDSIPPPPSYPPPPPPENVQTIPSKVEGQSDFQSFAVKLKSRLTKVDAPIVPKEVSQQNVAELYAVVDKGNKPTANKTKPLDNANGHPTPTKPEFSQNTTNIQVTLLDDQILSASSTNILNKPSIPMLPDEQTLSASSTNILNKPSVPMPPDDQILSAGSTNIQNKPSSSMPPDDQTLSASSTNIRNKPSVPMPPDHQILSAGSTNIQNKPSSSMPPDDQNLSASSTNIRNKPSVPMPPDDQILSAGSTNIQNKPAPSMPPDDQTFSTSSTNIGNKPSVLMLPDDQTLSANSTDILNRKPSAPIPYSKPIRDVVKEDLKNAIRRSKSMKASLTIHNPVITSQSASPKMSRKPPIVKPKPASAKKKLLKPSPIIGASVNSPAQAKTQSIQHPSPKTQHTPEEHP